MDTSEVLLTDNENRGLLVVGCYRSSSCEGKRSDSHVLNKCIRDLKEKSEMKNVRGTDTGNSNLDTNRAPEEGLAIQEIHIGNLSSDQSLQVVMALLSMNSQ
eukprot:scaffold3484_cov184-Amphora_coffeaeformis.AAC.9